MEVEIDILQYLKQIEEENKGRNASKVSKIATMFQFPCENDDRDEKDGSGPTVTVVRTESHVARFNTARALFEKMAEKKSEDSKSSTKVVTHQRRTCAAQLVGHHSSRSTPSPAYRKASSRSPSPASSHSIHHQPNGHHTSNSFKSPNPTSISTITSSYTPTPSSFHSSIQNPSIPSVLPLSVRSNLDSDVYKDKHHHHHHHPLNADVRISNVDVRNIPKDESHTSGRDLIGTGNRYINNEFVDEGYNDILNRKHEHSTGRKIETKNRPNSLIKPDKPAKPETLIDKPLSSHLQNQQIIQRHKNWFQSFSKTKSPLTSPQKPHEPTSPSFRTANVYEQRSQCEEPPSVHNDWRKERSAILKGSGRNSRQEVEVKNPSDVNVKNFEDVSTLPSCWSPPKQYNELSTSKGDKDSGYSSSAVLSTPGEDYRRDPSPSPLDRNEVESKTYIITDISKDSKSLNRERKHNHGDAHDTKHIAGVFKKGNETMGSSEGSRSSSTSVSKVANRSSLVDDDNALRQSPVVLRHRDDLPTDKELRLKEWEKRLSQRDSFHEGTGERIVADISSSGARVDRNQFRDSTLERRERKRLVEDHDNKRIDVEKNRKDVRKMEENSVQQRISGDEEREIRKRKLQMEKERLIKDEEERSRLRKEERRERLRKEDHREEERDRLAREEQGKERLIKEHDARETIRETEEQDRRNMEEKREGFRREEEKRESFRREEEKRSSLRREMERKEQKRESLRREKEKQERIRREEENEKLRREEEEKERLRREELERERIQREEEEREILLREEEEREKLRREEEERERLRREKEERERLRREKEERERLRREKEERDRLRMEEREKLRREEEERERLRREEEERERLRREEEMERLRREKEERAKLKREKEERERLKREEEERERLRKEEEEIKKLKREEKERERLKREEEERERLKREEEEMEKLKREEEERERLRREEEERERLRREKEERENLRRKEEEKERLKREEDERRMEKERLRREEEEKERLRREMKEKEKLRKEKEEWERLRREDEERERLRREKEEEERLRLEEELMERLRKEKEESERLKREEKEMEMLRRKEEERLWREEKERERLRKEALEKERLRREAEERERIRREEEERERLRKESAEKDRLEKEAEERLRREDEERERLRQEEFERREEMEREKLRKVEEEREVLRREEEREKIREVEEKEKIERKWHAKREKLEEEERIRREKDRVEIEKTKKRIAELKKERDEIQRQQAMKLRMLMKDETGETDQDIDQFRDASPDDEEVVEEVTEVHYPVRTLTGPRTSVHSSPSKDNVKTTHESQTHELITIESQSRNVTSPTNAEEVDETISNQPLPTTQSSEQITEGLVQNQDGIAYDLTVLSAQHKLEFCTSSYNDSICKKSAEKNGVSQLDQFSSSTLSSEFEPLPPPVPPHNVDPATLATTACVDQQRLPPLPIDSELPEPMTPEEAEKLLSHNIIEMKKGLLAEAGEVESSRATGSAQPPFSLEEEICRQEVDTEKSTKPEQDDPFDKDYDSVCVDSPTPDNEDDGDDSYGYFKHELTEDGFVVRAKEVLSEDGVHYLEDGHFWIQVPGLAEDDDDDLPESVPVHQHTKLKFSKDPIKLFSTFSVSDYDRRNDDVDPVAASAEYELEKRVEKMNVFPVCIEKGEGGLGLSIIGMGVGADAGVEKLGIFVKTITPGGATANDGMIQVNDQIIEVDNQSLVGVTQMFAASVLKNTSGTVNFLIGRENDPENSEVAMLIRQSLLADQERDERRRALEGPNYDPRNSTGIFESFSSQSGGDSPSEDTPRNSYIQQRDVGHPDHLYGGQEFGDQYGDIYGSCSSSPPEGASSTPPEAFNHDVEGRELLLQNNEMIIMSQHLQEIQHRNDMYEEEITILRNKIGELEKDLGSTTDMARKIQETTKKLKEVEDTLQARQAEIATYQDMLEQSQGQYIILEKKYYKAKKIIKEYQSRERDFLHREEYHITQLEEKDALYNSLVKALKDRVIQLEGDLIKAQQEAGLPVKLPPDLNSQSSNFVHSKGQDNQSSLQKNPPRKPSTINSLDADLSDTEAGDTHTSEGSKCSTVERKIPSKEELDVAVPPTELLDNSFSKAKGELASRGGLANRQLPSLKKSSSNASANSFEHSFDDVVDDGLPESQHQLQVTSSSSVQSKSTSSTTTFHSEESIIHSSSSTSVTSTAVGTQSSVQGNVVYGSRTQPPPPYQATHSQSNQTPAHPPSPHHQPPPYQPPPSAPLSYRPGMPSDPQSGRSEAPYRHPPPIARVQPVNRVEAVPSPLSLNNQQHQQTLAHQLKALLAEREGNSEAMQEGNKEHTAMKKSPSSLMEDVRRAVIQADMSIGKKPVISGPIHVSSTAQVVSTGQFVHNRTSPQKAANVGAAFQQKINRDSGSWSPVINASNSPVGGGVVLLSQRPIDSSLPVAQSNEAGDGLARKELVSHDSTSSFDAQSLDRFPIGRPPKEILSVFDWTKEQVAQWLVVQGLENYVSTFVSAGITGPRLINIDTKDLKTLGLSSDDKTRIKKKVKELRQNLEKERKQMEKENKEREKLQRKAEKLAEKAERRKK